MPIYSVDVRFRTEWTQEVYVNAPNMRAAEIAVGRRDMDGKHNHMDYPTPRVFTRVEDICEGEGSLGDQQALDLDWQLMTIGKATEIDADYIEDEEGTVDMEEQEGCYFIVDAKGEEVDDD